MQRYRGLTIWRCGKNSNPLKLLPVQQCLFFFTYSKIRPKLFENLQNLKILVFRIIFLTYIIFIQNTFLEMPIEACFKNTMGTAIRIYFILQEKADMLP